MNSDEFISKFSAELHVDTKDAAELAASVSGIIAESLLNAQNVSLENFGDLVVKKEMEHIVVNSSNHQRILVPPALVVHFEPAESLVNKMNI